MANFTKVYGGGGYVLSNLDIKIDELDSLLFVDSSLNLKSFNILKYDKFNYTAPGTKMDGKVLQINDIQAIFGMLTIRNDEKTHRFNFTDYPFLDSGYTILVTPSRNCNTLDKYWIADTGGNNTGLTKNSFDLSFITSYSPLITIDFSFLLIGKYK